MSNCIWIGDYEPPTVCETTLRKARKMHVCCECNVMILVGDTYEECAGLWDLSWSRYRTCARCVLVRADYFPEGWFFGFMAEDFQEAFGFDYREGIPADFAPCGKVAA